MVELEVDRWLYHADYPERIFKAHDVPQRLYEGWVKFPWEVIRKEKEEERSSESDSCEAKKRGRPPKSAEDL